MGKSLQESLEFTFSNPFLHRTFPLPHTQHQTDTWSRRVPIPIWKLQALDIMNMETLPRPFWNWMPKTWLCWMLDHFLSLRSGRDTLTSMYTTFNIFNTKKGTKLVTLNVTLGMVKHQHTSWENVSMNLERLLLCPKPAFINPGWTWPF